MKRKITIVFFILVSALLYSEELTVVTINAWSGLGAGGVINVKELEAADVRDFRAEVLMSGLSETDADIIVLNGINPAQSFAEKTAETVEMNSVVRTCRSGIRFGPVSIPLNLQEGDAILADKRFNIDPAGRKLLGGGISNKTVSFLTANSRQVIGSRISGNGVNVYVFSAVWKASGFSDRDGMLGLLNNYLEGNISPEEYAGLVEDAVTGAQQRLKDAEETLALINSVAGKNPVILTGSLNALPGSPEIKMLENAGFIDVFKAVGKGSGYSRDSSRNTNAETAETPIQDGKYRIDYIFVRGNGVKPVSAQMVFDEPVYGVYASDRFGIKAKIRLPESPSGQ